MLRTIHKNKKSVYGIVIICGIVLAMTGFGVSLSGFRDTQENFAIKVDDIVIDHSEFQQTRRNVIERYRSMLGKNFPQFEKTLLANLNQNLVDEKIAGALLEREARNLSLYVPEGEVSRVIQQEMFHGDYVPEKYAAFLRNSGLRPQDFEKTIEKDAQKEQLTNLISAVSLPSKRETRALITREETTYGVKYVEFAPEDFLKEAPTPDDAAIEKYYADHASQYELPFRVSYDYIVLDPAKYKEIVEVQPEDIELFYAENESKFAPKKLEEVKDQIKKELQDRDAPAYTKAKAEDLFDDFQKDKKSLADFALEHSLTAASTNGLLSEESDPDPVVKSLSAKVLSFPGEEKQLIELGDKSVIVHAKDFKESEIAPLSQVKDKVITALKAEVAKKTAKDHAEKFLAEVNESKKGLEVSATAQKLKVQEAKDVTHNKGLVGPLIDKGAQGAVFASSNSSKNAKGVFEVGGKYYVLQVTNVKKPEEDKITEKLLAYESRAQSEAEKTLTTSLTNKLKAVAKIDVDPGILGES